jgi:hypothetical protein
MIFSPSAVGRLETRRSKLRPPTRRNVRPSWGFRRSEMSMWDMIFRRCGRLFLGRVEAFEGGAPIMGGAPRGFQITPVDTAPAVG